MRPRLRVLGLLCTLLMTPVVQAEKLRLVADAWPPFTDISMPDGGLATAIVTTALQRAGFASEFEQAPWARALLGIGEGRYDVLVNAWHNPSRTLIGTFSSGYLTNRIRLLKRRGEPLVYKTLADLHGIPLAVVRDYAYSPAFDADARLNKIPVRNFAVAVGMLAAGRVDLTLEDEYVVGYTLQRLPAAVRNAVELFGEPVAQNSLHILVSLKNPRHQQIVAGFDQAIAAMKADGSYAALIRQHGH